MSADRDSRGSTGSGRTSLILISPLYEKQMHIRPGNSRPFVLVKDMAREFARQFYSSAAWQSCRNEYMKQAHHLCEDCLKRGIYKPAKEVHHIEELTPQNITNPEITLGFNNLVALCKECHAERHDNHGRWAKVNAARREAKQKSLRYEVDSCGRVTAR